MVITDPIADMLVRIANAGKSGKTVLRIPYSDIKLRIANILMKEGYVLSIEKKQQKGKNPMRFLEIGVQYDAPRVPRVRGYARVSRPSRRIYLGAKDIRPVHQGTGIMILSTPKGIMTGNEARKENVGGEVVCKIW